MPRPVIPIAIHRARGTDRASVKKRHKGELKLTPRSVGQPPDWFPPEAVAEWNRLVKDKEYQQVLAPIHRGALVEYCVLYARMIAEAKWTKPDKPSDTSDVIVEPPVLTASERQTLHSLRMQLGITPASASKVKATRIELPASKWAGIG